MFYAIIVAYVVGAFLPGMAEPMRAILPGSTLLSAMLVIAGMSMDLRSLKQVRSDALIVGVAAMGNLVFPLVLTAIVALGLSFWHNAIEVEGVLGGLALIIAMPIAGASTAWSVRNDGNANVSVALVVLSTLVSPFTTPLVLHLVGAMTTGDMAEDLHLIASQGATDFLLIRVVIPVLIGVIIRAMMSARSFGSMHVWLKKTSALILVILSYMNAASSLPAVVAAPDWDLIALNFVLATLLCCGCFAVGYIISRRLHAAQRTTLAVMYGLGMNNNGTGLVLASIALADHPEVMFPIIMYTLVQHIVASQAAPFVQK